MNIQFTIKFVIRERIMTKRYVLDLNKYLVFTNDVLIHRQ